MAARATARGIGRGRYARSRMHARARSSLAPGPPRRPLATAGLALAALAVALLAGEWIARARGAGPWRPDPAAAEVSPGGSLYLPDASLGWRLRPGAYDVRLPSGLVFHATHDAQGHRIAEPEPASPGAEARPELWIFGDSFAYGWSLDDEQTFPWRLQRAFPGLRVVSFAVGGYGTLHALLLLRDALATRGRPALVVLAHNFFHDSRNTFSRLRQREVAPWNRLGPIEHPVARFAPDGRLREGRAPVAYREVPGMRRSALAHLAATAWDLLDDRRLRGGAVTLVLLDEFLARAREAGVPVVVTTLEASAANAPLLAHAATLGARAVDVAVDLRLRENTNLPHDGHPSALAQRRYATRLARAIRAALHGAAGTDGAPRGP
jgi:hypothetical protein